MIHPNVCFLILLICCWVVTASLMAEKTNVGVAVFVADNTYVCGCGSDGAATLLSACSLVCCCSHQFGFPCLEVLLQGTPPPCTISCKTLPGHSVDAESLHISCADIFISQVRAASGSPPPMPAHRRGCLLGCDHPPYGEYDPTNAVCVV